MTNAVTIEAPEGVPFVDITREFDAPVSAVFRAFVDQDLVRRWLGPRGYRMTIEEWRPVSGGSYAYLHEDTEGGRFAFRGSFHTVRQDELIVQTFEYGGTPDVVSVDALRFEDLDGRRTRVHGHSTFPTLDARDGIVASGMEHGVREGYEQLDELLASAAVR
jgi:uncharacterized protein YndB with AHSA1/START domain